MKEYCKSNHLRAAYWRAIGLMALCAVGAVIFFLAGVGLLAVNVIAAIASFGAALLCIWYFQRMNDERGIRAAGLEGEKALRKALKRMLPDEYAAFFNIIPEGGREIDCLLVGPSGVYAFEAKHSKGKISYNANGWRQVKGRGKNAYYKKLGSPSGQIRGAVGGLKRYLKNKGIDVWIEAVLVFTHPEAALSISRDMDGIKVVTIDKIGTAIGSNNVLPAPEKRRIEALFLND